MIDTIVWTGEEIVIIDQTLLPVEEKTRRLHTVEEVWEAIKVLRVRGAPALGVAAAFGVVLGAKSAQEKDRDLFDEEVREACRRLRTSRPTAVNLFWALERMEGILGRFPDLDPTQMTARLEEEALAVMREDKATCRALGEHGQALLEDGDCVLTHCNAGALATADFGTALGVLYAAQAKGRKIAVYADETRPLLQGARLTCWELMKAGIDVTLICDNMAGQVMKEGRIQKVIVGADRIAGNGDAANKIGTYSVAVLARHHGIPFYVAAPLSTVDLHCSTGAEIAIEQRRSEEITHGYGGRTAPEKVRVYNPAFDVTPASLIDAIVTDRGIARAPYKDSLAKLFAEERDHD